MVQAKRTLKKFNFEEEGASVALVGAEQGGPANGITTLITKGTATPSHKTNLKKALEGGISVEMTIMEFLVHYLDLWYDDAEIVASLMGFSPEEISSYWASDIDSTTSYLESRLDKISINKSATATQFLDKFATFKTDTELLKKALGVKPKETQTNTQPIGKGVTSMPQEINQEALQEQINKALEAQRETVKAEMEAIYKQREDKISAELSVLKSLEDQRQMAVYKAQAEDVKAVLGDAVDIEVVAKALRVASESEDTKAVVALVKSLTDASKSDEVLVEKGAGKGTDPEAVTPDTKVEAIAKSLREADPTMPSYTAYCKAYEQVYNV